MLRISCCFLISLASLGMACQTALNAQEYQSEAIANSPSGGDVPEEFAKQMADSGVRVKSGSRTVCEIWMCSQWKAQEDFTPTAQRLYPFEPGQLIGLLHFPRRGSDFRDQDISSGWYSLRFGLQPIDGNHIGTSPTRDFLLMVPIEEDKVGKDWSEVDLNYASADAAGSTHPAMICLQKAEEAENLAMRHMESNDWWILHYIGKAKQGDEVKPLAVDLVVAGVALE